MAGKRLGAVDASGRRVVDPESKVNLSSLFIYHTYDDFDSADPSSMQDACYT